MNRNIGNKRNDIKKKRKNPKLKNELKKAKNNDKA